MKALTISQPFATLIANGEKCVENRKWLTKHRGPLAIHAGMGRQYLDAIQLEQYPTGKIIAVAQLVACVRVDLIRSAAESGKDLVSSFGETFLTASEARRLAAHKHTEGPFCWVLEDVKKLQNPVLYSGRQGLWEFDESLLKG